MMVCVCACTKWVEAVPLRDRSSLTLAYAFHDQVANRYGIPVVVRTDRGTEYQGEFRHYLSALGVVQAVISTAHPRSNGLVERYNRCIKEGLRKMLMMFPQSTWLDHLSDILAGLRMLPTHLGVSPYLLCFK